jgi:hypothetical protein
MHWHKGLPVLLAEQEAIVIFISHIPSPEESIILAVHHKSLMHR